MPAHDHHINQSIYLISSSQSSYWSPHSLIHRCLICPYGHSLTHYIYATEPQYLNVDCHEPMLLKPSQG
jgi:hypothetical protein